ncbi:hypothetical protein OUY22_15665 [Nonomuraea sp. MCN248]|uniref:Uncharacterized protein n=1 Tax=Nonomuraea corallina TaxID=2989783 RepID=A0ABT4SCD5_9ACTN|nr:hypothetical protein [Nonomuraea corallina]MDA0634861.1 hypothetical protein [Nonomuraea corallina]
MARVRLGFSPILPTIASFLLAALWTLSVFAGWGLEAFCAGGETPACERRLTAFASVSGLFAAVAACLTAAAWVLPAARQDERTFTRFMVMSGVAWIAAEGVLFLGGVLTK